MPEDRQGEGVVQMMSIQANMTLSDFSLQGFRRAPALVEPAKEESCVKEMIQQLAIKVSDATLPITSLSGGNQQKVVLGKALMTQPQVVFLDEPTRGIDVGAKTDVYHLIGKMAQQGLAVMFSSSELDEVMAPADRIPGDGRWPHYRRFTAPCGDPRTVNRGFNTSRLIRLESIMNQKYMIYMYLLKARTFIALLLVIAFFSVMVPNFLTASNLLIMTQHVAITGLLAIGMTLVILTGGIDLSVGAVAGICGMVAGALLTNGLPLWNGDILFFNVPEVILCVAIFGVLVGLVNGAVITRFGVAPFICTLGMMYVARGSALLFNDGSTYPNLNGMEALGNTGFATLGSGTLLGVYLPIWLMIGFLVLGYWLTTKTPLGRYIYAIGGNESAARLAGVPIVKAKIFVYAFSGLCAAFVGLIVASQLQTAHPMTGNMFEMDAIGATVLGGTALAGGRGRVTGSIIGAFVIVFLADGMVMMGVSDFWQMVIKGVVIVTAVVVDQFQQKLQSKVILMRRHEEKLGRHPPQRRHLQLTGNDSHLPPGLGVPGSAKGKKICNEISRTKRW